MPHHYYPIMLLLHNLHLLCGNFHMNIDVPAGVGASPTANDISSIRCCGYYVFHCLLFVRLHSRAATIRGQLLLEGSYYSRAATIRGWCLGNTIDILIRYVCMYGWEWDICLWKANIACNSLWWSIVWRFLPCAWGSAYSLSHWSSLQNGHSFWF